MIEVFKILNGIDHCDKVKLFQQQEGSRTRSHPFKLYKKRFRLDIRRYTFSQRIIDHWNNLSEHTVESITVNQFKSRLNVHWKNLPIKFQPDCYTYSTSQPQISNTQPEWILEANA